MFWGVKRFPSLILPLNMGSTAGEKGVSEEVLNAHVRLCLVQNLQQFGSTAVVLPD